MSKPNKARAEAATSKDTSILGMVVRPGRTALTLEVRSAKRLMPPPHGTRPVPALHRQNYCPGDRNCGTYPYWRKQVKATPYRPAVPVRCRSEEHTSELQSLMPHLYSVFRLN